MADLQDALIEFNKDKPNWYDWKNIDDGEIYSNVKVVKDGAVMPTEEEVNAKIEELQFQENRAKAYPQLAEQLDLLYHDMTAGKGDKTGEWYKAIKKVKDDNPKPSE
tara:strand:- start:67 stop:387 length:321 start_codon:yes stop_codon:yes gene_type:complete